ncbi:MAG: FMN reductase [Pseudolabrys sp.]|nr:FMN reductase [Pseudolabrys sp.]
MIQASARTLNIVGFSGNVHRPSRTRTLVETVIARIAARHPATVIKSDVFDMLDVMPDLGLALGSPLPAKIETLIERIASADALVVGTPVYKGSYTGLFKHLFDLVEPQRLAGLPVVLTATGGGDRHALVVEHQLRPLFGFFSAHTIATSIYASGLDFVDGQVQSELLEKRIDAAARDLTIWLTRADHTQELRKLGALAS